MAKTYDVADINIVLDVLESTSMFLNMHSCEHVFEVTYKPDSADILSRPDDEYKAEKIDKMRKSTLAANLANLWSMLDGARQQNLAAAVLEYRNRKD